jgi:hypothetical protein
MSAAPTCEGSIRPHWCYLPPWAHRNKLCEFYSAENAWVDFGLSHLKIWPVTYTPEQYDPFFHKRGIPLLEICTYWLGDPFGCIADKESLVT